MSTESYTKRIAYEAACGCGWKNLIVDNPPREVMCPKCKNWIEYTEVSWIGPDTYEKKGKK